MKKLLFVLTLLLLITSVYAFSIQSHWYVKRWKGEAKPEKKLVLSEPKPEKPKSTFTFKKPTSRLVKESEKKKVDDTPLAPKIRSNRPVRQTLHYTGKACRQSGSNIYFTAEGKSCTFTTPDFKQNQLSCADTYILQCIGFYCPIDACGIIGLFPPPEDRSEFENKTRPIRPI